MTGKPASKYAGLRQTQTPAPEAAAPTPEVQPPAPAPLPEAVKPRTPEKTNSRTEEHANSRIEEPETSGKPEKFGTMLTAETARRLRVHAAQRGMRDWQVVEAAVVAYLREHGG